MPAKKKWCYSQYLRILKKLDNYNINDLEY
jgi:hypothetical protein